MKIIINHVTVEYDKGLPFANKALNDINLVVEAGDFIGIAGHTGSGKSTLIQLFNGLIKPTEGNIFFEGEDIFENKYDRKLLRKKVGIVFQYPEHQLFAETVFKDVCFGPLNMGESRKAAELSAYEAIKQVGLPDEYFYQSPFDLSGGQRRRAAIAGILAMKPEVLVLDEPTAGLDPGAQKDILDLVKKLHDERNITVIMVSHNMQQLAEYTNRMVVLDGGVKILDGATQEVFACEDIIRKAGLEIPEAACLIKQLKKNGLNVDDSLLKYTDVKNEILKAFNMPVV